MMLPAVDMYSSRQLVTRGNSLKKPSGRLRPQTVLPNRWVIASDGSVDATERIVRDYAEKFEFIELLCVPNTLGRSFSSKVYALHAAMEKLAGVNYQFIGNLDADVTVETQYFEELLREFGRNPNLGLAGGYIHERHYEKFTVRAGNSVRSVAGAVQMFRRDCYESVGGSSSAETRW